MNNLLVTGGSGFIGSNFIRYLLEETDFTGRVINVDKLTYAGNPENLKEIPSKFPDRYAFEKVDICDPAELKRVFDQYRIDSVCHFAAESHVDRSIVGPAAFVETNITGTFNLLELARANAERITIFHHVSTDEVFGSLMEEGYFTEATPYRPNSPYSASKAASDHLVRAYHKTYGLPVTISNCSNNYGSFQFPEKLVPLTILNALEGKSLPIYGDGLNVRDWLYVRDHCVSIWLIMRKGTRGEMYNVGGNNEWQNIKIVETICDQVDEIAGRAEGISSRKELVAFVKDRPGHDRRYAIDSSRIKNELGWRPEESFESGLKKTIRWYLDNREWVDRVRSGEYRKWIRAQYGDEH